MPLVTITKAIELSPVSRTQFYKSYVNTGSITVTTNERGKKQIDTAELLRVFGKLEGEQSETVNEQPEVHAPLQNQSEQSEVIKLLKEQIAELKADKEYQRTQIATLTNRLEAPAAPETSNKELEQKIANLAEQLEVAATPESPVQFAPAKRQSRLSVWWYGLDK